MKKSNMFWWKSNWLVIRCSFQNQNFIFFTFFVNLFIFRDDFDSADDEDEIDDLISEKGA